MARFVWRFGSFLLLIYLAGGGVFLWLIESVWNGGFSFSAKILWLPLAVLIFGFTWANRRFFRTAMRSGFKPWLMAALLYPIALLMSWPYVMALNAATARGDTVVYKGPIERKWIHSNRSRDTCEVDLRNTQSAEVITVSVSHQTYASLSVGEMAEVTFMRGGFGIPYQWRFHRPNEMLLRTVSGGKTP